MVKYYEKTAQEKYISLIFPISIEFEVTISEILCFFEKRLFAHYFQMEATSVKTSHPVIKFCSCLDILP